MRISNRHMRQIHGELKMKRLVPISFAFLFMALTSDVFARPARPSQIPNGSVFSCANCHVNPAGGGDRNIFGSVAESGSLTHGLLLLAGDRSLSELRLSKDTPR